MLVLLVVLLVVGANSDASKVKLTATTTNVYTVMVVLNDRVNMECLVDSGASMGLVYVGAIAELKKAGLIDIADILPPITFSQASGDTVSARMVNIKYVRVGTQTVPNVQVALSPTPGKCLLGQSYLKRLTHWSINNETSTLILGTPQ
jgi:predicted aspartyl protease